MNKTSFPEIQDSFGQIGKSFLELYWAYMLGLSAVVILLLVAIYYIFKPKPKVLSAYEKAIVAIRQLNTDEVADEEYTTRLSDIVRVFLEEHYNLPAPERTTPEFIALANKSIIIEKDIKEKLQKLLELSDMVKFAKQAISPEQKSLISKTALELIEKSQEKKEDK
ncbi:MAG: hypothetical protein R3Y46_04265 [Opitutales bacterium]